MEPVIELAGQAERDRVVELLGVQLAEHGMGQEREALEKAVQGLLDQPSRGLILVARVGGEISGIACLSFLWTLEHGGFSAWLDELYVVPGLRSRGMGRALLLAALDHARAHGAVALDLEVDEDHARAEHLYEREGFRRHRRARWARRL